MGYTLSFHNLATAKPSQGMGTRTAEQKEDDLQRHKESLERLEKEQSGITLKAALHKLKVQWLYQIKHRAIKAGMLFDLDAESLELPDFCPILGIKLKFNTGGADDNSYSMDRIDNTKGYTKDNAQIISLKANRLKSNATLDELIKMGEWAGQQKIKEKSPS